MANKNYNTFVVVNCKTGKIEIVTSSARKAKSILSVGKRIEVWSCNKQVEKIYEKNKKRIEKYTEDEKAYIREKQRRAVEKNKRRRMLWQGRGRK